MNAILIVIIVALLIVVCYFVFEVNDLKDELDIETRAFNLLLNDHVAYVDRNPEYDSEDVK